MGDADAKWTTHTLSDGSLFLERRLPAELLWGAQHFEAVWGIHPEAKHRILMHGRLVETPRWQQAYGDDYHYTGRVNQALPIPDLLVPLFAWSKSACDPRLTGILLNWYEGPGHYIGPHHDSIKQMIPGSPIVTVSFGETRVFRLTRGKGAEAEVRDFSAIDGTVFMMPFDTNLAWKHSVPKSARYRGRRISVTFRGFERTT